MCMASFLLVSEAADGSSGLEHPSKSLKQTKFQILNHKPQTLKTKH